MQFFLTLAAVVAVAVATPVHRGLITPGPAGPAPIIEEPAQGIAIGPAILELSPISVGPAIVEQSPVSVGPAIIEQNPISVGPAIIEFPLPDGGAAVEPTPVVLPAPVVVPSTPLTPATPVVQIIVNINQQQSDVVAPAPVEAAVVEEVYVPGPVNVVDNVIAPEAVINPVQVVEPVIPGPVNVVEGVVVSPVQVVEPVVVEPVQVGTPIIPAPAVVLPETLN